MNPLSIKTNDFIVVSLTNNALSAPVKITNVVTSTVGGQKSYAVTAGGIVYTCTYANTVVREKTAIDTSAAATPQVSTWVLSQ